jgi:hypothetical protein
VVNSLPPLSTPLFYYFAQCACVFLSLNFRPYYCECMLRNFAKEIKTANVHPKFQIKYPYYT